MNRIWLAILFFGLCCSAQEKTRIYVTDSDSWQVQGGSGGASPQTAEVIKTIGQRCSEFTVTGDISKANYVLRLEHEGGKEWTLGVAPPKVNKIVVYNKDKDVIFSTSTRTLGNAVKDACAAVVKAHGKP